MNKLIGAILLAFILIAPYQLATAGIGDSQTLFCAVIDAIDCKAGNGCSKTTAEDINISQFIKVDLQSKKISSVGNPESKRESAFKNYNRVEGSIIIQGSEEGRGWSAVIDESTGKISATIVEGGGSFVIFGACIPD